MRSWRRCGAASTTSPPSCPRLVAFAAGVPPADRRTVRNAIATNVLSGWHPSTDDITRLVAFAAGKTNVADYLTAVTRAAHTRHC